MANRDEQVENSQAWLNFPSVSNVRTIVVSMMGHCTIKEVEKKERRSLERNFKKKKRLAGWLAGWMDG